MDSDRFSDFSPLPEVRRLRNTSWDFPMNVTVVKGELIRSAPELVSTFM